MKDSGWIMIAGESMLGGVIYYLFFLSLSHLPPSFSHLLSRISDISSKNKYISVFLLHITVVAVVI